MRSSLRGLVALGLAAFLGAAGLGRLIQEHLVARDYAAVLGACGALVALTLAIDALSAGVRRSVA